WALPWRIDRIREMLGAGRKFDIEDFERMQQDVISLPARRFQEVLRRWHPEPGTRASEIVRELLAWNAELGADSQPALIYEALTARMGEAAPQADSATLEKSLDEALQEIEQRFGKDRANWQWGKLHQLTLTHSLGRNEWKLGPVARPGDANTVNATGGANFHQ